MDGSIGRVRISDGTFRYRARYRDPSGRQHERRFPRKVDAQRWLDEATSALLTRTWTAPERGRVTVAEWAERWLAAQTGIKPSTHYRYSTLLRAHVLPAWGNHRLADVTHADVATWVAQLRQGGSGPAGPPRPLTAARPRRPRRGDPPQSRGPGAASPDGSRRARFLTRDHVELLADAAGEDGDVIRLLANTGLRFGGLAALRVRRVDFLRKRLMVAESATEVAGELVFGTPKTHQQRTVPLPADLVEPLARRCEGKQPDDLLLTTPTGTPLRLRNWRRMVWNPAGEAAGLSDITPTISATPPHPWRWPAAPTPRRSSACSATPLRP
jgi:integrase